jgi:hypothetical protein
MNWDAAGSVLIGAKDLESHGVNPSWHMWRSEHCATCQWNPGNKVWTVVSRVKLSLNGAWLHAHFASLEKLKAAKLEGRLPYSSVTEKTHADYATGTTLNADGTTLRKLMRCKMSRDQACARRNERGTKLLKKGTKDVKILTWYN